MTILTVVSVVLAASSLAFQVLVLLPRIDKLHPKK